VAELDRDELLHAADGARTGLIQWELRVTDEGLLARFAVDPPDGKRSVALDRRPQDIALPAPATATSGDLAWLAGAWVGTRGTGGATSLEERWSPPLGGAMLGTSRTVRGGKMSAFEIRSQAPVVGAARRRCQVSTAGRAELDS
jgi:hypothetical protein